MALLNIQKLYVYFVYFELYAYFVYIKLYVYFVYIKLYLYFVYFKLYLYFVYFKLYVYFVYIKLYIYFEWSLPVLLKTDVRATPGQRPIMKYYSTSLMSCTLVRQIAERPM